MRSRTSAFLRKTCIRASSRCAVPSANGAASASAHGHATISTEVNALSPRPASPAATQNTAAPERDRDHDQREPPAVTVGERVQAALAVLLERLVVPERRQVALRHRLHGLDLDRAAHLLAAGVKVVPGASRTGSDSPVTKL